MASQGLDYVYTDNLKVVLYRFNSLPVHEMAGQRVEGPMIHQFRQVQYSTFDGSVPSQLEGLT